MADRIDRVAIVVLNWNGADIIGQCLDSLSQQNYPNYQIVVVDNGSKDASKELLADYQRRLSNKLRVIYNGKNSGFAGGVNIDISYSLENNFDAVALFNNDAVAEKSWIAELVAAMNHDTKIGITTSLLLHEDGKTIDSTGDWYSIWGLAFPRLRDEPTSLAPESGYVFGASGGASLYRSELFREIGMFDERFFAYYEDVDLSFRAQLAGWKVYYTKQAVAYHKRGITSERIPGFTKFQMFKNLPMLFLKNVPLSLLPAIGLRFVFIYWLMFVNASLRGNFIPALKGFLVSLVYLPGSLRDRWNIQKNKKVSTPYLGSIIWQSLPPNQKGILRRIVGRKQPIR